MEQDFAVYKEEILNPETQDNSEVVIFNKM